MTIDFNDLSDMDLERLFLDVQKERIRRTIARKEKLINAFREAFNALHEAGYNISIEDRYTLNFDDFEFN